MGTPLLTIHLQVVCQAGSIPSSKSSKNTSDPYVGVRVPLGTRVDKPIVGVNVLGLDDDEFASAVCVALIDSISLASMSSQKIKPKVPITKIVVNAVPITSKKIHPNCNMTLGSGLPESSSSICNCSDLKLSGDFAANLSRLATSRRLSSNLICKSGGIVNEVCPATCCSKIARARLAVSRELV